MGQRLDPAEGVAVRDRMACAIGPRTLTMSERGSLQDDRAACLLSSNRTAGRLQHPSARIEMRSLSLLSTGLPDWETWRERTPLESEVAPAASTGRFGDYDEEWERASVVSLGQARSRNRIWICLHLASIEAISRMIMAWIIVNRCVTAERQKQSRLLSDVVKNSLVICVLQLARLHMTPGRDICRVNSIRARASTVFDPRSRTKAKTAMSVGR